MNARAVFSVISFTEMREGWATALSEGESKMSAIIFADLSDLITRGSLMPAVDIMQPPSRKKRTIRLNYTPEAFCCQGSCRCLEYMSSCIEVSYAVRSFPLPEPTRTIPAAPACARGLHLLRRGPKHHCPPFPSRPRTEHFARNVLFGNRKPQEQLILWMVLRISLSRNELKHNESAINESQAAEAGNSEREASGFPRMQGKTVGRKGQYAAKSHRL